MKQRNKVVARCSLALGTYLAALTAGSIGSAAMAAEGAKAQAPCSPLQLSQLFLPYDDTGWYALLPGETTNTFDGARWRLDGRARIVTARLSDGRTGRVLDLPHGSSAVSPPVCVSSDFTTARTMVRMVAANQAVSVYASVAGSQRYLGQIRASARGWAPSDPVPLQSAITGSQQRAQFTLVAGGRTGEAQLYDFALDPRMK